MLRTAYLPRVHQSFQLPPFSAVTVTAHVERYLSALKHLAICSQSALSCFSWSEKENQFGLKASQDASVRIPNPSILVLVKRISLSFWGDYTGIYCKRTNTASGHLSWFCQQHEITILSLTFQSATNSSLTYDLSSMVDCPPLVDKHEQPRRRFCRKSQATLVCSSAQQCGQNRIAFGL